MRRHLENKRNRFSSKIKGLLLSSPIRPRSRNSQSDHFQRGKRPYTTHNSFGKFRRLRTTKSISTHTSENVAGSVWQNFFSVWKTMHLPSTFWSVCGSYAAQLAKTLRADALFFLIEKSFVFQLQPRFPKYGLIYFWWCAKPKSISWNWSIYLM